MNGVIALRSPLEMNFADISGIEAIPMDETNIEHFPLTSKFIDSERNRSRHPTLQSVQPTDQELGMEINDLYQRLDTNQEIPALDSEFDNDTREEKYKKKDVQNISNLTKKERKSSKAKNDIKKVS